MVSGGLGPPQLRPGTSRDSGEQDKNCYSNDLGDLELPKLCIDIRGVQVGGICYS
jgi:hypothetical protein